MQKEDLREPGCLQAGTIIGGGAKQFHFGDWLSLGMTSTEHLLMDKYL